MKKAKQLNPPYRFMRIDGSLGRRLDDIARSWEPRVSGTRLAEMLIERGLKAIEAERVPSS